VAEVRCAHAGFGDLISFRLYIPGKQQQCIRLSTWHGHVFWEAQVGCVIAKQSHAAASAIARRHWSKHLTSSVCMNLEGSCIVGTVGKAEAPLPALA